ncbi:hypothetical protein, partial [Streptomyces sp. MBT67]|uniref:hypothetical protein n=1 Tax=Streptomyces sp. MBT67 TaxID=1488397 RepID=UPI001F2750A3
AGGGGGAGRVPVRARRAVRRAPVRLPAPAPLRGAAGRRRARIQPLTAADRGYFKPSGVEDGQASGRPTAADRDTSGRPPVADRGHFKPSGD